MGRPKGFERDQVLDAAMQVFWQKGYEATSLHDLVAAMGINRVSLYREFKNKNALYLVALDHYRKSIARDFLDALTSESASVSTIRTSFLAVGPFLEKAGWSACMLLCAATERAHESEEVRKEVHEFYAELDRGFLNALGNGCKRGELPSDTDIAALGSCLTTMLRGINVTANYTHDRARIDRDVEMALRILDFPPRRVEYLPSGAPPRRSSELGETFVPFH